MAKKVHVPLFSELRAVARDPEGKILLGSAITTIVVGTGVYMWLEGWDWIDALYFSVVTLATVGFGDLHPTTDVGKLFTVFYIIMGVGIIAGFVSEIAKQRRDRASGTPVIDEIEHFEDEAGERRRVRRQARVAPGSPEEAPSATGPEGAGPTVV